VASGLVCLPVVHSKTHQTDPFLIPSDLPIPLDEVRMINHFHRIGPVPNVKFVTAYIAELPHILVVVVRPIPIGAEVLIDYGYVCVCVFVFVSERDRACVWFLFWGYLAEQRLVCAQRRLSSESAFVWKK